MIRLSEGPQQTVMEELEKILNKIQSTKKRLEVSKSTEEEEECQKLDEEIKTNQYKVVVQQVKNPKLELSQEEEESHENFDNKLLVSLLCY